MQKKLNYKKIIIMIAILITGVLLYCGCQANYQKNIVIGEQNAVFLNDTEKEYICYFNDSKIFYTKVNQIVNNTYTIDDFCYYDRNTQNTQKICELENASIQNMIDMGDNIFMCFLSHNGGEMMKIDLNKNTNEILYQWDSNSSISYSDKWTDSNIVTFYTENTANEYIHHFLLFDNNTGKQKEFFKTVYDRKNNIGDIASCYCFYHDNIVIYNQKYNETDNVIRSLDFYDMDGNLKDSIVIDISESLELSEEFEGEMIDTIRNIHSCGNNIILSTQHKRILFFNIDSGKLLDMKYYDILHEPLAYYNTVNDNYAIFYNGASKRTENNTIIIFNGNTGKFYHHNIVFEEPFEKQYIESIVLNDSGEMLITTKQNLSSQKHYFIVNVSDIAQ